MSRGKVSALDVALAARLRCIRQEQGKYMRHVADFLDTTYYTVSLIEKGLQPLLVHRFLWWCVFLDVKPGELVKLAQADILEGKGNASGE